MRFLTSALAGLIIVAGLATTAAADPNQLTIELKDGPVVIQLMPEVAPKHVERIKDLATKGEYDNVAFHRVIDGFMAQTGDVKFGDLEAGFDPNMVGTGGSDQPDVPAEFSNVPYDRGVVGMARSQDPDSANSQFFIMFAPDTEEYLKGKYTVVGKVVSGMENVDKIKRGDQNANGAVTDPDRMIKVTVGQ